jgi:HKD family nuclease
MSTFITNDKTNNLRDRIAELINFSQELKFLVGFFYFSGANELYDSLVKNPDIELKILVGLEVDKLANQITEKEFKPGKDDVDNFMLSTKATVNSYLCDNQGFYDKIEFFIKLIKNDKLKIRKTKNPNHAKLYIFNIKEEFKELKKSCFITGSSNLTRSGLVGQDEFNVEISDYGNEITEEYFDKL